MRNKFLEALKWYNAMGIDYFLELPTQIDHQVASHVKIFKQINLDNHQTAQKTIIDKINAAREIADKTDSLAELKREVENFDLCSLKHSAKNLVFSDGNSLAKVMLIGEAPGANEDEEGIPFCGASGKLLDNMLYSIGLLRKTNCYITNTVFWRPPDNRQPTSEEVDICRPFLEKHIAIIKPKFIILVGAVATASIFGTQSQISKMRGQIHQYSNKYIQDISTSVIFHPAYLMRQPSKKKLAWFDLLHLQKILQEKHILN
jgi:uracil-DNA glycosylase family 4